MRITFRTTAIILILCLLGGIRAQAQISLSFTNAHIRDVIVSIEKQSEYSFYFKKHIFNDTDRVTIQVRNVPIESVLNIFKQQLRFDFKIAGKIITVLRTFPEPVVKPAVVTPTTYLRGIVTNEQNDPLFGTTVYHNGAPYPLPTDIEGKFSLPNVKNGDSIAFSNIGYERLAMLYEGQAKLAVKMIHKANELSDVSINSGLHSVQIKRATGAFSVINNKLLNRSVSVNILDRLEGTVPGILFNKNIQPGTNQSEISIRGRSTILGKADPLIVLDNFPYSGALSSINPNDIEKIVVLKDATSAGIWGAYSGNGVIVITTKKGKYNQPLKVATTGIVTVGDKPDLFYGPYLSSASKIELERFLFGKNYYTFAEQVINKPALSPVVELLIKRRDNKITEEELNVKLNEFRNTDVRYDMERLLYQRSLLQQYGINMRGGGENNHYYFSVGYDGQKLNMLNTSFNRVTSNLNNTFLLLDKKLELNAGMLFSYSRSKGNFGLLQGISLPYTKLADNNGNPLSVPFEIRQAFKDTAGKSYLLDWNMRPLEEARLSDDKTEITSFRVDLGGRYKILKGLEVAVMYQYARSNSDRKDLKRQETYFTRSLINQYTRVSSTGEITRNVPFGGIMDMVESVTNSHNGRLQLIYNKSWGEHELSAVAGVDIRTSKIDSRADRLYGYNEINKSSVSVNFNARYPLYHSGLTAVIPNPFLIPFNFAKENFISSYATVLYSYKRTLNASLNIRKDESNLFGVKANQKGVPLGALGLSWNLSSEKFYNLSWLPELKLRVSNGFSGNVDLLASAFTAASYDGRNIFESPTGSITNPPNPSLEWERSYMLNVGLDFIFKGDRVSGSLDAYYRKAVNLIGYSPIDPTTGVEIFRGNTSSMEGNGVELGLNACIIKGTFNWNTILNASYSLDRLASYKERRGNISFYLNNQDLNPLEGKPLYSVYALKWVGLDPLNGDPQGVLDGKVSKDYSKILNSVDFDDLIFKGSAVPKYYGSWLNTFKYKGVELSCLFTYKLGYFFRRSSVNYFLTVTGQSTGHPDFDKRWKAQGDEKRTNVPAFVYPATDFTRDDFYASSEVLVEKGDHIRLRDVRLSYKLPGISKLAFGKIEIFGYVRNVGLLWKANNYGIDPDFVAGIPESRTYSLGVKMEL